MTDRKRDECGKRIPPTSRGEPEDGGGTRRSFLWKLWWGMGGLVALEYAWIALDLAKPGRRRGASALASLVVAGPVERFEPGTVTAFPEGKFYLARLEDGGFLALSRTCTHLGCTVPWSAERGRFECPCHASAFDIRGDVLCPPAPQALDLHPIRIENGIVKVDTRSTRKRRVFESAQVSHP